MPSLNRVEKFLVAVGLVCGAWLSGVPALVRALAPAAAPVAAAAVVLAPAKAKAGEKWIGQIISGAGADTTNSSTATPFYVPLGSKLSIYCTAAANFCADQSAACTTSGAGMGVPVAASTLFPTSVSKSPVVTAAVGTAAAGGAVIRIVGAGAVTCQVWAREGNE